MVKRKSHHQNRMRAIVAKSKPACHICGKSIDYEAHHTDPLAFVIDHVIPLAKGGEDALSNIKAAHRLRSCNSLKRAQDYAPIVRRSPSLN